MPPQNQVPPQPQGHQNQVQYPPGAPAQGQYTPHQQQQYQQYNPNSAPAPTQPAGSYQAYQHQPQQPQQAYQPQAYQNQNQTPTPQVQAAYQNQNQSQGPPATAPTAPTISQKSSINMDLLSDIDFNVMPAVQPLAPSPAHSASSNQNQDLECDHVLTTISPVKSQSVSSSIASYSTSTSSFPSVTPEQSLNRNQSENQIQNQEETGKDQSGGNVEPVGETGEISKAKMTTDLNASSNALRTISLQNGGGSGVKSIVNITGSDPFLDPAALEKFTMEVERFEKTVEDLAKKSLNGPATKLDLKWKDLLDIQV